MPEYEGVRNPLFESWAQWEVSSESLGEEWWDKFVILKHPAKTEGDLSQVLTRTVFLLTTVSTVLGKLVLDQIPGGSDALARDLEASEGCVRLASQTVQQVACLLESDRPLSALGGDATPPVEEPDLVESLPALVADAAARVAQECAEDPEREVGDAEGDAVEALMARLGLPVMGDDEGKSLREADSTAFDRLQGALTACHRLGWQASGSTPGYGLEGNLAAEVSLLVEEALGDQADRRIRAALAKTVSQPAGATERD